MGDDPGAAGFGALDGAGEPPIGVAGLGAIPPPDAIPPDGGVIGRAGAG
jgi:hypothetical protein